MDRDPPEDHPGPFRGQPACPLLGKLCGIGLKAVLPDSTDFEAGLQPVA